MDRWIDRWQSQCHLCWLKHTSQPSPAPTEEEPSVPLAFAPRASHQPAERALVQCEEASRAPQAFKASHQWLCKQYVFLYVNRRGDPEERELRGQGVETYARDDRQLLWERHHCRNTFTLLKEGVEYSV